MKLNPYPLGIYDVSIVTLWQIGQESSTTEDDREGSRAWQIEGVGGEGSRTQQIEWAGGEERRGEEGYRAAPRS
jgi:hypothetical protein